MDNTGIIVGLDIGTTKICAIVGERNAYGKIDILGVGKSPSNGVVRGVVTNIDRTVESIRAAIDEASRASNVEITHVHVGIAGQHIKSHQHRGSIVRRNYEQEIAEEDISRLVEDMHKVAMAPGEKIIHIIPQEYTVDGDHGIKDPIGMSGIRLEGNFHIITGQVTAAKNIHRCVEKAGLHVVGITLEPIASAASVLSDEEKEAGVALVDIGGGTTDIAIFQDGIIRHTAVIPLGGNIITEDIKHGCTVMSKQAEALKVQFGNALAED
ncbi:cell division protein FtsA, partial [bacterium]|nr:cell division protein FtsA [bacterium]